MVRPKKHLGQHFLKDENIARKVVEALSVKCKTVIEVGAGTGVLSKHFLADKNITSWFFEVDPESITYLLSTYPEIESRLIHEDFLRYELHPLLDVKTGKKAIIGNFPYNISSQILFKVLDYRDQVDEVVGMFQKEVAERIASGPGTRDYGILSVLMQAFYDVELLFTVNPGVFFPPPNVKSAVLRCTRNRRKKPTCPEDLFFKVVKAAFNQRRKTLRNALHAFSFDPQFRKSRLLGRRAEQLGVADFIRICKQVRG
ncbi:MAG: 16S rRNA (adenine(1518)-N(6)/adenine(1519)-N(6))-dimethyltransferase RsmA [Bacteroidetes bacterium]|nr:16S rRNA (adenine(1518)-N(6)/adenine(1519)-N(6))-dimethyltransferase RsmA [Bacteroidota bacterium]